MYFEGFHLNCPRCVNLYCFYPDWGISGYFDKLVTLFLFITFDYCWNLTKVFWNSKNTISEKILLHCVRLSRWYQFNGRWSDNFHKICYFTTHLAYLGYGIWSSTTHITYSWISMGLKSEGNCGLWVFNKIMIKICTESLKKIVGAVWEIPAK